MVLEYPHYDTKCDIWSAGCIFFELLAHDRFIETDDDDNEALLKNILKQLPQQLNVHTMRTLVTHNSWNPINIKSKPEMKPRPTLKKKLGLSKNTEKRLEKEFNLDSFCDLLGKMLEFNWEERWTAEQCINHPFFDDHRILIQRSRNLYPIKK